MALIWPVLSAVGGCGADVPVPLVERRDSAGVEIVEAATPRWSNAGAWHIDSLPIWQVSGTSAEYEFSRVTDATVLIDGHVVVLNEGTHEVRFFDPVGDFLTAMGREGEGPGDFQRFGNVSTFRGDSVLVFDFWLRRASILDAAGNLGRVLTLSPDLQVQELHPVTDHYLVAKTWSLEEYYQFEGPYRARYQILGMNPDGEVVDSIAWLDGWSGFQVIRDDGTSSDFAPLFIYDGHLAVNGHAIVMSSADQPSFIRYSPVGEAERIVRIPSLAVSLSQSEIQAERAAMLWPEAPASYRQVVNRMPAPALRPAHGDILLDPEGYVWAARYWSPRRQADEAVLWDIFHPDGDWLGTLSTPERFSVLEIGVDYVLGIRRDDLDVEHVEMLRLNRVSQE